jgi:hypothetical protein
MSIFSRPRAIASAVALLGTASCKKQAEPERTAAAPPADLHSLTVPAPLPREAAPVMYKVQKGDTLSRIAETTGTSLKQLMEYNDIKDPNRIFIGQSIEIPGNSTSRALQNERSKPNQAKESRANTSEVAPRQLLTKGNVPPLSIEHMPTAARAHAHEMSEAIQQYAVEAGLGLLGPPLCGQGVCTAFLAKGSKLSFVRDEDCIFAHPKTYREIFKSPSRDAYKIRQVLEALASREDSGWVRVRIHGFPKVKGFVVRHSKEGQMYLPTKGLPGVILCYDPNPDKRAAGRGAEAWGHIEWRTKGQDGKTRFVHAVNTEVHGGSPWGRKQFHLMIESKNTVTCYAFVLTTPEVKEAWLQNQTRKVASQ